MFLSECEEPKACTIVLRGGSKDVLNELERNLQDAMQARQAVEEVEGGGGSAGFLWLGNGEEAPPPPCAGGPQRAAGAHAAAWWRGRGDVDCVRADGARQDRGRRRTGERRLLPHVLAAPCPA